MSDTSESEAMINGPGTFKPYVDDTCFNFEPSEGIAELLERLVIANLKLFAVCEEKKRLVGLEQSGQPVDQHELLDNIKKDLDLCRSRAAIRAEINKRLGSFSGEVVKTY